MKRSLFLSCIIFLVSNNLYAFKFSPMSTSINIDEKQNSTLFYLENDSDKAIAVETSLLKREMNQDGVESNTKIEGEMTLYPTQLIIPPNEKRSVKVTWLGKEKLAKELAYRLVAEQLPIDMEKEKKKKGSIKVLLRYVAALYITDDSFEPNIEVEKIIVTKKDVGFLIKNNGKKHQLLSNLNLKISGEKKKELKLLAEDLKGMSGENILANTNRLFRFPKAGKFQGIEEKDKVAISFDKE